MFVHDPEERIGDRDVVGGINNATKTLLALTIRVPCERALDVGTGCGVQALFATRHARHVVATDVNPRALELAGLTASLNGVGLDLREGSWFEPVAGEAFDLIVANPPYVISPDTELMFRDSGLERDEVSRLVVRGAAAQLREGGYATVLCNWVLDAHEETWGPLESWVRGTGCDALLVSHEAIDPFRYAASWNALLSAHPAAFDAAVERWLDYYERSAITALGFGGVVLRRRTGDNWVRAFALPATPAGQAGPHLLRLFAAGDAPLGSDEEVLATRLAPAPRHVLVQSLRYGDAEYEPAGVTMALEDGLGFRETIDGATLSVLFELDGARTLGGAVAAAEVEAEDVLPTIRRLYDRGLLELGARAPE